MIFRFSLGLFLLWCRLTNGPTTSQHNATNTRSWSTNTSPRSRTPLRFTSDSSLPFAKLVWLLRARSLTPTHTIPLMAPQQPRTKMKTLHGLVGNNPLFLIATSFLTLQRTTIFPKSRTRWTKTLSERSRWGKQYHIYWSIGWTAVPHRGNLHVSLMFCYSCLFFLNVFIHHHPPGCWILP